MIKTFTRAEILADLKAKVDRKEPIIMGGAGIGLIAKIEDMAGIDAIMAYNTGPFRMDGHPSCVGYLAYGDSNQISMDLAKQILPVVKNTPVIGGIGAGDPYRDIDRLIGEMMEIGYSGITNVPTAGAYDGVFRHRIDTAGVGYPEEVKLIEKCRKRDIFTVAYAYHDDEVKAMIQAGVDCIKIEGRAKSAYYAAIVTGAYRHCIDDAAAGRALDPVWRDEVDHISHRIYSTGFYYGEPGQYVASSRYIREWQIVAKVESCDENGLAVCRLNNKFRAGDALEVVGPDVRPFPITAPIMADLEGNPVEEPRTPQMKFTIQLPKTVPPMSMLRRSVDLSPK